MTEGCRLRSGDAQYLLQFAVLGLAVEIRADSCELPDAIGRCFSAFPEAGNTLDDSPIIIQISANESGYGWQVSGEHFAASADSLSGLLYCIDKALTHDLQYRRPELYFLHAAVLSLDGRGIAIAGASGAGKSTLCWHLCNSGFRYISDELAPIDPETLEIQPYPRALCLKKPVDRLLHLPETAIVSEHTVHVPVNTNPTRIALTPARLDMVVFLQGCGTEAPLALVENPQSTAAAALYAHGLNQLAHDRDGLRTAATIAAGTRCYELARGNLDGMCSAVTSGLCGA